MKALIACGGTGGHLFPGLAVGEALVARGDNVMLVVSEKEIDRVATANMKDMAVETLPAIAMPSVFSPRIIPFGIKFLAAVRQVSAVIKKFQPDVVLGMGGFTCAAPILAARKRGIPTFLHESNAIPGKANRWLARRVTEVFIGFEECADKFSPRATVTGTPVRASLVRLDKAEARKKLSLAPDRFTVLVLGGSQGANAINAIMIFAAAALGIQKSDIQIIHATGASDYDKVFQTYRDFGVKAHVKPFINEIQIAYSAADLAVSRAGAATLTELVWFGLPSILIPYPHAAEKHQHRNAEIFERAGAAMVLEQAHVGGPSFAESIKTLRSNSDRLHTMSVAAFTLRRSDVATKIIERMDARRRGEASATAKPVLSIAIL